MNKPELFGKPIRNYNGGRSKYFTDLRAYLKTQMGIDTAGATVSMDFTGGKDNLPIALRTNRQDRVKAKPGPFECIYCQVAQRTLGDYWGMPVRKALISDKGTGWAYCGVDQDLKAHTFVRFYVKRSSTDAFDAGGKVFICDVLPVPVSCRLTARAGKKLGRGYQAKNPQGKNPAKGRRSAHMVDVTDNDTAEVKRPFSLSVAVEGGAFKKATPGKSNVEPLVLDKPKRRRRTLPRTDREAYLMKFRKTA